MKSVKNVLFGLGVALLSAQAEEWDDLSVIQINTEAPHAAMMAIRPRVPSWVMFRMDKAMQVTRSEITWEQEGAYQYLVEGSSDGKRWELLADQTHNAQELSTNVDTLNVNEDIRYVRVTVTGVPDKQWPSIREIKLN